MSLPLLPTQGDSSLSDVVHHWHRDLLAFVHGDLPRLIVIVVISLALIRIVARNYFDSLLTLNQTGALFFVLAFGMILRWRMNMYFQYRRLTADPSVTAPSLSS